MTLSLTALSYYCTQRELYSVEQAAGSADCKRTRRLLLYVVDLRGGACCSPTFCFRTTSNSCTVPCTCGQQCYISIEVKRKLIMAGEELKQSMEKCFSFSCTVEASNKFDELLQVEHDEEVQQGKEVLACHSLRELVARGFCVSNLHLESQRTGLNGRYLLHFVSGTKHGGDSDQRHWLQCSTFKQGDIVSVRMFENPSTCKEDCMDNLTGVVWKLGSSSITISLEENCAESSKLRVANCKSKFSLVKLANDITYRRYKRCVCTGMEGGYLNQ